MFRLTCCENVFFSVVSRFRSDVIRVLHVACFLVVTRLDVSSPIFGALIKHIIVAMQCHRFTRH